MKHPHTRAERLAAKKQTEQNHMQDFGHFYTPETPIRSLFKRANHPKCPCYMCKADMYSDAESMFFRVKGKKVTEV